MSIMMVMPTKKRKVDEDDVGDIGYNGIIKSMDMDNDDGDNDGDDDDGDAARRGWSGSVSPIAQNPLLGSPYQLSCFGPR